MLNCQFKNCNFLCNVYICVYVLCFKIFFVIDINECGIVMLNNCLILIFICKNKDGGYVCECKFGFIQKNLYECEGKCYLYKIFYKFFMILDLMLFEFLQ